MRAQPCRHQPVLRGVQRVQRTRTHAGGQSGHVGQVFHRLGYAVQPTHTLTFGQLVVALAGLRQQRVIVCLAHNGHMLGVKLMNLC